MQARIHVLVSGLVQGVGYRYFTCNKAVSLNLSGYVHNLYSGQVEIEAEGDRSMVEEFLKEMKIGPRAAHVTDMKVEWIECTGMHSGFEAR